jgi:hypothetical protein
MELIPCPTCGHDVKVAAGERRPPWCPRCGADFRAPVAVPAPRVAAPTHAPPEVELSAAEADRPAERLVTREDLLEGKTYQRELRTMGAGQVDTPFWVWLFAGACLLVGVGGGVAIVFGVGGAVACVCAGMSRSEDRFGKLMYCGGITVLCWVVSSFATMWWITQTAAPR